MAKSKLKFVVGEDIYRKKYKLNVDKLSFRVSVYAVVFKGNKILLSRFQDGYDFPGGGIEIDETMDEALKREVWEETGMKVEQGEVLYANSGFFRFPTGEYFNSVRVYFLCKNPKGEITDKNFDDFEKIHNKIAQWVDVKAVGKLKFYNGVDSPALIAKAFKIKNKKLRV